LAESIAYLVAVGPCCDNVPPLFLILFTLTSKVELWGNLHPRQYEVCDSLKSN